jgi:5-hydroxyisourate hydrolase
VSAITTHVLDTTRGRPGAGIRVTLERRDAGGAWIELGVGRTDRDGRLRTLLPDEATLGPGPYRLRFETGAYFDALGLESFHPIVEVTFEVRDPATHHHVPLLVSPYGYTTYRGS